MQVTDSASKKSFKILPDQFLWATNEQNRLLNIEGRKITQPDLFERMRERYEQAPAAQPRPGESTRRNEKSVEQEMLSFIMQHGSDDDRRWITGNLKNFCEAIRSRPAARRAGGK